MKFCLLAFIPSNKYIIYWQENQAKCVLSAELQMGIVKLQCFFLANWIKGLTIVCIDGM